MNFSMVLKRFAQATVLTGALASANLIAAGNSANEQAAEKARELADKIQEASKPAGKASATATSNANDSLPKGNPCALLTDAEVRKVYPKASGPKPERTREKYGILACIWEHPTGKLLVQLTRADPMTAQAEARGLILGFVDPLKKGAANVVRVETIRGVGDEAAAIIETQDGKRGILNDVAYLYAQRGDRQIMISATDLASGDRALGLKTLEALGRAAIGRL